MNIEKKKKIVRDEAKSVWRVKFVFDENGFCAAANEYLTFGFALFPRVSFFFLFLIIQYFSAFVLVCACALEASIKIAQMKI